MPPSVEAESTLVSNLNTEINLLVGCSIYICGRVNTYPSRRTGDGGAVCSPSTWKPVGRLLFKSSPQTHSSAKPNVIIIKYCPCIIRRITQWRGALSSAQPQFHAAAQKNCLAVVKWGVFRSRSQKTVRIDADKESREEDILIASNAAFNVLFEPERAHTHERSADAGYVRSESRSRLVIHKINYFRVILLVSFHLYLRLWILLLQMWMSVLRGDSR